MSVYLQLYHGRTDPDAQMEDWGTDGPLIGPLEWIKVAYLRNIRIAFLKDGKIVDAFFGIVDDMIFYDGVYYGDYEVISASKLSTRNLKKSKAVAFDQSLTTVAQERDA